MIIYMIVFSEKQKFKKKQIIQMFFKFWIIIKRVNYLKIGKYLYIVLPYCNGGDLGQELLKKTMLPEKEAISILK